MRIIFILAVAWALAGCQEPSGTPTVVQFWAMGREGEVVRQLIPDFERAHPDVRVEVQQLPWTAAHEKLLTAFAGDALPDVAQLGNTWLPEFAALRRARSACEPSVVDADDYFPGHLADQRHRSDSLWGAVVRRYAPAVLSPRSAGRSGIPGAADHVGGMDRHDAGDQGNAPARSEYGVALPLNEYEPLLALALQQGTPLLRDGGHARQFSQRRISSARCDFYLGMFRDGLAPATSAKQISNVWDEFARGPFAFYITGPWNIGEFKRRLPREPAGRAG